MPSGTASTTRRYMSSLKLTSELNRIYKGSKGPLVHESRKPIFGSIQIMRALSSVGLISDTHGLLRPEALTALEDSDLIIHAGDIGAPDIIDRLRSLAPVVAVRGNIDNGAWASRFELTEVLETGSARIFVLHDIAQLDFDPAAARFNVVVSGHSHKPSHMERDGVLYVNPGSAGPRSFRLWI